GRGPLMNKVRGGSGRFAVSVLAADQEDLARYFSDSGRPGGMAQFVPVGWHPGPVTAPPLLHGALAPLECDVEAAYDGGDHTVFLGRARRVERAKADGNPLL